METQLVLQIVSTVSTTVIAIAGVFAAYYWGYMPRKRKLKEKALLKELHECYRNIDALLSIEQDYMSIEDIGKKTTRQGRDTTKLIEPTRMQRRMRQLEEQIQELQ